MNLTEIARRLNIPTNDLKMLLPAFGFGVGRRAIKVDKRIAEKILSQGDLLKRAYDDRRKAAIEADRVVVPDSVPKELVVTPDMTVRDFATLLSIPVTKLVKELMKNGIIVTLNDRLDIDTATIIAQDLGRTVKRASAKAQEAEPIAKVAAPSTATFTSIRPPVVVIMGHVDHGKTKLLDTIRSTNVVAGEAGGITQHIGAYQVTVPLGQSSRATPSDSRGSRGIPRQARDDFSSLGRKITFIDTPGHEAFTTMRSRGARVADIAILVVAADDGVQPQTKEAINIIQGSNLPMIVALNKMDKDEAQPDRVKKELSEANVIPEEYGGKVPLVPVSAKTGTGIDQLLEMIALVADVEKEKRKTNADVPAVATVIESNIHPGAGPLATVLVQLGTLRVGDVLGSDGVNVGKVRALHDWNSVEVKEALPGMPIVVLGLKAAPEVGETITVAIDPKSLTRHSESRDVKRTTLTSFDRQYQRKNVVHIPIILRADVVGSLEAIVMSLEKMNAPDATVTIVSKGLGSISENDVLHAEASGAAILGFHVDPTSAADLLAREKDVQVKKYMIIYDLLNDVKVALEKKLIPEEIERELGSLQVFKIFKTEPQWVVLGGKVMGGKITPGIPARIVRNGIRVGDGFVKEVRVGKEEVREVVTGNETGIKLSGFTDVKEGDVMQVYVKELKKRVLAT